MKPVRPVYILGGAHTPFIGKYHPDFIWKGHPDYGKRENPTLEEFLHRAARGALEAARVPAADVDRAVVGNFTGECFARQGHLGSLLAAADDGLWGKPIWRVEGACASGGLALVSGIESIASGSDLVLVAGVEVQTTVSAAEGADFLARASHYATQHAIDRFPFPCLFARRTRVYKEKHGVSDEKLASVVVKAHRNAARNPLAHLHAVGARMDLDRASRPSDANPLFLENPEYREHLKLNDCSPVSDGASALVLASREGLEKLGRKAGGLVRIAGYGVSVEPLAASAVDPLRLVSVAAAAAAAYRSSGASPGSIEVAEVHDCFHIAEVQSMEALGFAEPGRGADIIADGATAIEGDRPVNTGGGLIGFGHPVGATGVKQALEVSRQLRGECGDYQIPSRPRVGLTSNMGGDDRTAVVAVYRFED